MFLSKVGARLRESLVLGYFLCSTIFPPESSLSKSDLKGDSRSFYKARLDYLESQLFGKRETTMANSRVQSTHRTELICKQRCKPAILLRACKLRARHNSFLCNVSSLRQPTNPMINEQ